MGITTLKFIWFTVYCTTLLVSQTPWTFGNEVRSRMKRLIFTNRVKNEKCYVKKKENILHSTRRRKANLIGYSFRTNSLPKRVTEGKIKVKVK